MTVERWAQQIIEKELSCPVVVHDDGSQPSMYDLRIGVVEAPDVAIECVGAVDSVRTETWNVGPGRGPLRLTVKGDWLINIAREAHIRTIRQHIEPILRNLEERDVLLYIFIYSSYRAAPTVDQRDRSSLNSSPQGVAYVSSAVGGSLPTLSFEDNDIETRTTPHTNHGRAFRGRIRGFSRASRTNLLRRLASINRGAFRAFKGRLISITLTYPREYPKDPELCKRHLKALRKRLQRMYGPFAAFWRLGIQTRGAWHFHLLLFVGPSIGPVRELRRFISSSWYEDTGKVSEGHLRAGTRVEPVKRWKEATSYVERYMAKPEEFPEGLQTGRIWGLWNGELLPVRWETAQVSVRDAFRIRRTYRKLAKRKGSGSLRRITVFVRYENVVRLLKFLGYHLE